MRTALSASLVLSAALSFASAAHADDQSPPDRVPVSYRDVDFNRPEAVEALYKRLQFASKVACDTLEPEVPYREADDRACEREAVQGAVHDVDRPALTALHARAAAGQLAMTDERRR